MLNISMKDEYAYFFNITGNLTTLEDYFNYQDVYEYTYTPPDHYEKVVFSAILFVVSFIANILLIVQQSLKLHRQELAGGNSSKSMPYMVLNLAVSNLTTSLFTILETCIRLDTYFWYGGNAMCKIVMFLSSLENFMRPYSVVALLMAYISERGTRRNGRSIAIFYLVPVWGFGILFSLPMLGFFGDIPQDMAPDFNHCGIVSYTGYAIIIVFTPPLGCFLPAAIASMLSCVYCIVGRKGAPAEADREAIVIPYNATTQECSCDDIEPIQLPTTRGPIKVSYIPLAVSVICFLLWTPFYSFFIIVMFGRVNISFDILQWLHLLSMSSAAIVPIIILVSEIGIPKICRLNNFGFGRFM